MWLRMKRMCRECRISYCLSSRTYCCYQGFVMILLSYEGSSVHPDWFVWRNLFFGGNSHFYWFTGGNGTDHLVEQNRMELGFVEFVTAFRREHRPAGANTEYSAVDLLSYCSNRGAQSLLQLVFCLGGGVQSTCNIICEGIWHLPSDVMSCVCAVIYSYLSANHVRSYGSVSGPLLQEVMESHRRVVDLPEITEGMLWDDVGIVAGEDYRLQLYASLGYDVTGERSVSPEIGTDLLTVCVVCCFALFFVVFTC